MAHRTAAPVVVGIGWICVGALVSLGFLSILTIGALLLVLAGVCMAVIFLVPALRAAQLRAAWLTLLSISGLSAGAFLLAWLNRDGPGSVCHTSLQETSCADEWSPWPLGISGVVLLAGGIALTWYVRRAFSVRVEVRSPRLHP
ncbi:hypothetical protein [Flexivirga endophytica]|uniref:hypothetical protein n=1 Tax=Flexivirga endophytica TaxID=1849103 RepID=UPI001667E758|nr:hypothetical protein [Flexivirga endophytica]